MLVIGVCASVADGESIQTVIGFRPPSIENGEIQSAVKNHFLTAGTRSFQRPARSIQPDIDSLHEMPSHIDVVVFDKDKLVGEARIAHQLRDLAQHVLAWPVVRMSLSGKHKLDRTFWIVHHRSQQFQMSTESCRRACMWRIGGQILPSAHRG